MSRVREADASLCLAHDVYESYRAAGGIRSHGSWRMIRYRNNQKPTPAPEVTPELKQLRSWREMNRVIEDVQNLRGEASRSRRHIDVHIDTREPICIVALGDTHIGSVATDHRLLEKITDEILSTPNLYVCLLGDILDMAVKLRGVAEVQGSVLPTELQYAYAASWLEEIAPRVICATWGNHDVDREEALLGSNRLGALYAEKRVAYHNGIGHVDLHVGRHKVRTAVSHHYRGRSVWNPVHGAQRYGTLQAHDRTLILAGDSHVPGVLVWEHGGQQKIAINTGSLQTHSGYAARYFSLFTSTTMPCVMIWPDEERIVPFWSLADWRAAVGGFHAA